LLAVKYFQLVGWSDGGESEGFGYELVVYLGKDSRNGLGKGVETTRQDVDAGDLWAMGV
jgi:hypothetical protein